ncbi:hypothetical protein KAT36_02220 [Candidatus Pacearchaeota archaeon]|nr:hypothetical protein [Candidatus Pacearchaeota archaeon]
MVLVGLALEYIDGDGRDKCIVASHIDIDNSMCAQYSRIIAKKVFGREYTPANAWDLKYANRAVVPEDGLRNGQRGDIVTFFSPLSRHNTRGAKNLDIKGNVRNCTHAGLIYDFNKNGDPVVVHQYLSTFEVGLLSEIEKKRRIRVVEIIRTKD